MVIILPSTAETLNFKTIWGVTATDIAINAILSETQA